MDVLITLPDNKHVIKMMGSQNVMFVNDKIYDDAAPPPVDLSISNLVNTYTTLSVYKNRITPHHLDRTWDHYKKYINKFESIYSPSFQYPSVSSYKPVSRSFFKLCEILHEFGIGLTPNPTHAVFLAEGPGGFVEAFARYRKNHNIAKSDQYHAITLSPGSNHNVPSWRLAPSRRIANEGGVEFINAHEGDICDMKSLDNFINSVGKNKAHFITGDGGFDFSQNFNCQEERATQLVASQIYAAIEMQHIGGTFILKIYDVHTTKMVKLLSILYNSYENVAFIKPYTSRPANSEKYVVCMKFKGTSLNLRIYTRNAWYDYITIDPEFAMRLAKINNILVNQQIDSIDNVLSLIMSSPNEQVLKKLANEGIQASIQWCLKYGVPTSNLTLF
jgi:23S rRNA U2552 (ribose-2'-O)-methylase RlmE/FtsJ